MYSKVGRASVPPERLLKASLLISLYSVRSERAFCEELEYNLLFRWFLDMNLMERSFDPTVFTKNRKRLLEHRVGQALFDEARCHQKEVVRGQIAAHYPQARIVEVPAEDDPLRLRKDEQAWGMSLLASGPEYVPLRTFRDDDLLDPGSDPLIALLGSLSALRPGERIVSRLLLRSLGPDWSQVLPGQVLQTAGGRTTRSLLHLPDQAPALDGITMAVLGLGALGALQGYLWFKGADLWKSVLLGLGVFAGVSLAGWARWRWKKASSRVYDPLLIRGEGLTYRLRRRDFRSRPSSARETTRNAPTRCSAPSHRLTDTMTTPPEPASGWARYGQSSRSLRCILRCRASSAVAAYWECGRPPALWHPPEQGTRHPWWSGPGQGAPPVYLEYEGGRPCGRHRWRGGAQNSLPR